MRKLTSLALFFSLILAVGAPEISLAAKEKKTGGKNPVVVMLTSKGTITLELDEKQAPNTVKNFLSYVEKKYYDGTIFHRVIPQFMIQGGGFNPNMNEKGGTSAPIKNEASKELKNKTGTIAMARTPDPDSATAQFFINVVDNSFLDYRDAANPGYAVFGKVISGMDVVQKIEKVATKDHPPHANVPVEPVVIKSVRLKK